MRLRDLFVGVAVLCVAMIHFILQWVAWKVHLGEVVLQGSVLGSSPESLWSILSFPVFTLVPRSKQFLYFSSLLLANSVVWGLVVVYGSSLMGRMVTRRFRKRRAGRPVAPLTQAEQIAELRWLAERGLISVEQYQLRREVILTRGAASPPPPPLPGLGPKPGTRIEPRKMKGIAEEPYHRSFAEPHRWSRGLARGR